MMGELKFFLRLQIKYTSNGIYIRQTKYMKELMKKYKLEDAKEKKTLMHPTTYFGLDEESKQVENTQYRTMTSSLLHLSVSKPDIMFSECLCAKFQKDSKEVHLTVVKRILVYLIRTPNLDL